MVSTFAYCSMYKLGLLLGAKAPVMMPNSVDYSYLYCSIDAWAGLHIPLAMQDQGVVSQHGFMPLLV